MEACTPTSRPSISLVMIDSISIEIDGVELSQSQKCEHFTIRGFVSDTCLKNGTHCWPLSADDNDARSSMDIHSRPHIYIPKFRQWQCQSCLSEIDEGGTLEDNVNTTVRCSRLLKTKNHHVHRSLENVLGRLLKKSEQHPKLGCTQCKATKSVQEFSQKQPAYPDKLIMLKGLGEFEQKSAACDFTGKRHLGKESNSQLTTSTAVDKHQEQWLASGTTTSMKVGQLDGAKHSRQHSVGMKLVQNHQNHDDSGGTGCRKIKKLRLLNDLFEKDIKGNQSSVSRGFKAKHAGKLNYRALGQKRNKKRHEKDYSRSQMQNASGSDGKDAMRKDQVINSRSADAVMRVASKDGSSAISNQAQKMLLGSHQGAYVQKNIYNRGPKRNINLCWKEPSASTCQPFLGRVVDPQKNSAFPSSQSKRKSIYNLYKVHQDVNVLTPADNCKEIDRNSMPKNLPVEKVLSGHLTLSVHDDQSGESHYHVSDECLDPRKGIRYHVPHTENGNFQTGFAMQYTGKSKSVCKSMVDKNMWQQRNSFSGSKRPIQVPCTRNKKQKFSARRRTNDLTVVHQTEELFGTVNKRVTETRESPEHGKNMMQDDIPMEIVELLAKNQYERRLHEEGDSYHKPLSGSFSKHAVGSTSVVSNEWVTRAQVSNSPNVPVNSEKGSGISNKRHNGEMMQRYSDSTNCPALSSKRNLPTGFQSSLGSSKSDIFRNCKYDMNEFPPHHRVSPKSRNLNEEWQPASRQSYKTAHAWPMIPPNHSIHMLGAFQGSDLHPFDAGNVPACSSYAVEGRSLSDLRLSGYEHRTDSFRPGASNASRLCRVDSQPQMRVSSDPFANETITAMHLLSLMDGGIQSSAVTNTEAAANRKTFYRCSSSDHLSKELSLNNLGLGKSNHKFKQPSPYGYQSNSNASFKCSRPVPRFGSVVGSLTGNAGNQKAQERTYWNRNCDGSLSADERNGFKSQESLLACGSGVKGLELTPAHDLSKHITCAMWPGSGSHNARMNGSISASSNLMPSQSYKNINREADLGACYINRNPMEFTTPGPGNEYMIGTKELKVRNRIHNPYIINGPVATKTFKQSGFTLYTPHATDLKRQMPDCERS